MGEEEVAERPVKERWGPYLWRDGAGNGGWRNHLAEKSKKRGNQEAERAQCGERLFRTRLKTLCRLSSPSPAPSGSIYGRAKEGGEGGGGSCQQFI